MRSAISPIILFQQPVRGLPGAQVRTKPQITLRKPVSIHAMISTDFCHSARAGLGLISHLDVYHVFSVLAEIDFKLETEFSTIRLRMALSMAEHVDDVFLLYLIDVAILEVERQGHYGGVDVGGPTD